MMYDPKTGKGYKADTYKDHLRMDKMGYTHEKPEVKEGYESKSVPLVRTGQGSFTKDTHPKRKDGKVERMYQAKDKAEYQKLQGAAKSFDSKPNRKSLAVTVVFDNDKQRKAFEKKMKIEAYHEGAEMDIAKEREKMVQSKEKIKGLQTRLKRDRDREQAMGN